MVYASKIDPVLKVPVLAKWLIALELDLGQKVYVIKINITIV